MQTSRRTRWKIPPRSVFFLDGLGIAKYKLPEYLTLVDELPMTPTGKVQKFKLKEAFVSAAAPVRQTA